MLKQLMAMTKAELKSKLQAIDISAVKGRSLKRKFEAIRNKKEGGFTLLELLVVVLILAAIAGTATIMLQDTDRRGAAGAHVAMMDELSKGIQTFRVLNQNKYPDIWDSLFSNSTNSLEDALPTVLLSADLYNGSTTAPANIKVDQLSEDDLDSLKNAGITRVRILNEKYNGYKGGSCANSDAGVKTLINSKENDVTAQNIYRLQGEAPGGANGCGYGKHYSLVGVNTTGSNKGEYLAEGFPVFIWSGNPQRAGVPISAANGGSGTGDARLIAFGIGPDSTLFDPSIIGALSNTPVYRHVEKDEYNRFIVLWNVSNGPATFQAIIDGAGDTKDEELGEIDNVRPT